MSTSGLAGIKASIVMKFRTIRRRGDIFSVDHTMICKLGGFVTHRHKELRDLEAELLSMVCRDVEDEPVFQEITGEEWNWGSQHRLGWDARLDIVARGFWKMHRLAFFDVRVAT